MGNAIMKGSKGYAPPLLDETQIFSLWSICDLKELLKRFQNQVYGFALVEAQFESIISFKSSVADHVPLETLFDILDNDHDGRIDGLELLGGLTLCCHASFEEKARFCFELFDFNLNSVLSKKELVIMMMSSICGMNLLTGGGEELEPDLETLESLADDAILRADKNSDGQISFEEFLFWARSNRELMAGLEALNRISNEAKMDINPEDSAPETDDDDLSDTGTGAHLSKVFDSKSIMMLGPHSGDHAEQPATTTIPWLGQIFEPTNYKKKKGSNDGPDTNLELSWAFGYKASNCRNNVRYIGSSSTAMGNGSSGGTGSMINNDPNARYIVYFTAALGVIYNPANKKQSFYLGHKDSITCLALHPNNQIVATADIKSEIHIWNTDIAAGTVTALCVMKGMVKEGIMRMAFSPLGDRVATVGLDDDHTVCIHSVNTGEIIASTKGLSSPNTVFDIAYSNNGTELCLVGKQQIKFCLGVHSSKRAIETQLGKIGTSQPGAKRQTFFCVTYFKDDCIVGCASGALYRFREGKCIGIIQAHGIREPVLCMYYNSSDGTLLTGGKDCLIKTWDYTLKAVGESIDISEDVDGDGQADSGSLDGSVISIQQHEGKILVGTRGSDIFEAIIPSAPGNPHSLNRIAWGHAAAGEELWGLAIHPLREEFATCGDDKTLRIWSIRSHEQINLRVMPDVSRCLAYSPNGEVLCLGMKDGSMALMESQSSILRVYATWKHSDAIITDIKFSPDGVYIAAGSGDANIYIYKSTDNQKTYSRQAVCRGHSAAVTHLDFSANSQYIQSNGAEYALLFWDIEGNQVKNSGSTLRDVRWASYTCTLGWPVQGIWDVDSHYSDINTCMALPDIGDIVIGDQQHKVKLFKYPSLKPGSLYQTYVGHAGSVTCVRFSANKRFVISIGGADRTILLWKHDMERDESESENEGGDNSESSSSSASSADEGTAAAASGSTIRNSTVDTKLEIANVGPRSLEQEAVNMGWSLQEMKEYVQHHSTSSSGCNTSNSSSSSNPYSHTTTGGSSSSSSEGGGGGIIVQPWRSVIVEPTHWVNAPGSSDVDLNLKWVHGYRAHDCRNNVLYSASGAVVYNTAQLAVVFNKGAGKQQFLKGAHIDEIVGICGHPAGQLFATGETGRQPSIIIWNSKDMQVQSKIEHAHENGVPLLAFNSKGNVLATIGLDKDNSLCLHEWMKGVQILKTPTDKGKVLCLCFLSNQPTTSNEEAPLLTRVAAAKVGGRAASTAGGTMRATTTRVLSTSAATTTIGPTVNTDIVVSAGERHVKFWWSQGQNVQSQRALWGKERREKRSTVMCVASANRMICVTGSSTGALIIWQNFKAVSNVRDVIEAYNTPQDLHVDPANSTIDPSLIPAGGYPHKSALQCIYAIPGTVDFKTDIHDCVEGYNESSRYITGDRDGSIAIWRMVETAQGNLRLILMKAFHTSQLLPSPLGSAVRSVCIRDGILLLGLKSNEIYEISESSFPFIISTTTTMMMPSMLPTKTSAVIAPSATTIPAQSTTTTIATAVPQTTTTVVNTLPPPVTTPTIPVVVKEELVQAQRLSLSHGSGEVWGLAMHPHLSIFITAGDDCSLKCWSLTTQRLISYIVLPDKCRAVDIKPTDGKNFTLALNSGIIWVLQMEMLLNPDDKLSFRNHIDPVLDGRNVTDLLGTATTMPATTAATTTLAAFRPIGKNDSTAKAAAVSKFSPYLVHGPTQWVQVLKYSFEGSFLAAGSHDHKIYLYHVIDNDKQPQQYTLMHTLADHSSFVTHLDFGILLKVGVLEKQPNISSNPNLSNSIIPPSTTAAATSNDGSITCLVNERYDVNSGKIFGIKRITRLINNTTTTDNRNNLTVSSLGSNILSTVEQPQQHAVEEIEVVREVESSDICIQSCSGGGANELFFWRCVDGTRITSASAVKDVWWSTLTCPFGWAVQGIWPINNDGTEINAVARSNTWEKVPVLSIVDNFGRVRLYNYPCVMPGAADKCYKGHASNTTNIMFSYDDAYCVTVGGNDKNIFIWETDIQDEIRERAAATINNVSSRGISRLDAILEEGSNASGASSVVHVNSEDHEDAGEEYSVFKAVPAAGGGDQSSAVKPWKGAVREPSTWKEPADVGEEPDASLELKFVYGYRGWDCRNNISFCDSRYEIVYHIAGVGVVFNTQENKQLHNTEHDDDILCLDVHPQGHTVATGEIGKFPKIVLWDANTGVTIRVILFHKRGVSCIAFSASGDLLVSVGLDDDRTVAVHNANTGAVLGRGKAGKGIDVYTLNVGGNEVFITGGKNHIKFWELPQANSPGGELSSKTGIYNLKTVKVRTVVSSAFLGTDAVTGMQDGSLLLWKDRSNTKCCQAHTGSVTAMYSISNDSPGIDSRELGPRVISGGKDGCVHIWDMQLRKMWSLNMNETTPISTCPQVQAVAMQDNRLIIGTKASEIYEVSMLNNSEVYRLVQGHFGARAEVWGLAVHPTMHRFVTCGDDMTVRLWDAKCNQQIEMVQVDAKVRAVCICPGDGAHIAVATMEGKVQILSSNLKTVVAQVTVSSSWIQCMTYSPDGKILAVGSHDDTIYLLETKSYSCRSKCKAHHSFITAMDFSVDSTVLQSTSGDYELLFWNCSTVTVDGNAKQIVSPTDVRDVHWATFTCTLGWPVQGIWPANADGTDVNAVDRSPDGCYLVTGDDFQRIKLFRYPCPKERCKYKEYKGHAEHVMNVRFSFDGKFVFSVGGLDKGILQFEVKRDHKNKFKPKIKKV